MKKIKIVILIISMVILTGCLNKNTLICTKENYTKNTKDEDILTIEKMSFKYSNDEIQNYSLESTTQLPESDMVSIDPMINLVKTTKTSMFEDVDGIITKVQKKKDGFYYSIKFDMSKISEENKVNLELIDQTISKEIIKNSFTAEGYTCK